MPGLAEDWRFWIDRGGTFTDCIGLAPDGTVHVAKILSSDSAPVDGMRRILARVGISGALPPCRVRLGTTVATNALLTRQGAPTLLVTNLGLGDVLEIGTQERPDLFALHIEKPAPLYQQVVEVAGRHAVTGELLESFREDDVRRAFAAARAAGIEAVAIVLIHAYAHPC